MHSVNLMHLLDCTWLRRAVALVSAAGIAMVSAPPAAAMYVDPNPGPVPDYCPPGYACIWDVGIVVGNPPPEHRYYRYGTSNFVNEYGEHTVWNHQTGGARVQLCLGYNGTNCTVTIPAGSAFHGSLTPFNSIKLLP